MKWILDDQFLKKTEGKASKITKGGDRPLPWWFAVDWLRPTLKVFLWNFAVMFGTSEKQAETGYRLGIIVDGHAYVSDVIFHHRDAYIYVNGQDWTIFAVDLNGEVIPDGAMKTGNGVPNAQAAPDGVGETVGGGSGGEAVPEEVSPKKGEKDFWVDPAPMNAMDQYLDGRAVVD